MNPPLIEAARMARIAILVLAGLGLAVSIYYITSDFVTLIDYIAFFANWYDSPLLDPSYQETHPIYFYITTVASPISFVFITGLDILLIIFALRTVNQAVRVKADDLEVPKPFEVIIWIGLVANISFMITAIFSYLDSPHQYFYSFNPVIDAIHQLSGQFLPILIAIILIVLLQRTKKRLQFYHRETQRALASAVVNQQSFDDLAEAGPSNSE